VGRDGPTVVTPTHNIFTAPGLLLVAGSLGALRDATANGQIALDGTNLAAGPSAIANTLGSADTTVLVQSG
jgi:hypothetical protein